MKPPRSSSHTHGRLPQQLHRRAASSGADRRRFPFERWIYGRHAVAAALANPERRWYRLAVLTEREQEARTLIAIAAAARRGNGEPIRVFDRDDFAALLPEGAVHQGLALAVEPLVEPDLEDVLRRAATLLGRSVILLLDQVTDPHNVGAVLRSANAFGALAVVLPMHGAPPVTGALAKAASGALENVPLVRVVNLAHALDRLKAAAFWICGLDETASQTLAALDLGERVALVLGSEGGGMRRLVRERCDYLARLPTRIQQSTINVSNAAAVALYELLRDRSDS
ncbi:MAG TPA: 23S rRNA (guanosine(2251)-2'-O)-methyltransferase RlmB [Stellaceae bacterium]|nr:23S rRNA (guanosine(2251)-2'-O)-methyltransferase RlmB [Stellaceae bacterium]